MTSLPSTAGQPPPVDQLSPPPPDEEFVHLRLYVAEASPKSMKALVNLQRLCEEHLHSRYEIEVIDLVAQPHLAKQDDIVAIPTLVRRLPEPIRRVIGDLSNSENLLVGLRVRTSGE